MPSVLYGVRRAELRRDGLTRLDLRGDRIDDRLDLGNAVGGEASSSGMVAGQYLNGSSIDAIVKDTGHGQGTVSAYLNEVQKGAGVQLIRIPPRKLGLERLQAARPNGLRRAAIRDFHSFRVTWLTLALAAGVPRELVQRVTGRRTVEVVMTHDFRPGREDFRAAIFKAMPKMLADAKGRKSIKEEILALLDKSSARTWKADVQDLRVWVETLPTSCCWAVRMSWTADCDGGRPSE